MSSTAIKTYRSTNKVLAVQWDGNVSGLFTFLPELAKPGRGFGVHVHAAEARPVTVTIGITTYEPVAGDWFVKFSDGTVKVSSDSYFAGAFEEAKDEN